MSDNHKQVSDQCRVVAHLATTIAQVHSDKACIMADNGMPTIVNFVGKETARLMETLGDILNGMDAVTEDDDWTAPIFEEAQRLFPVPQVAGIPVAQYEALMAAKEVLLHIATNDHPTQTLIDCPHDVNPDEFAARQALAALRAAGIPKENK